MQRPVLALFALFAIVAFVACGGDDTARPTPAPTASVGAPLRSLSLIGSTRTAEVKVEIASTFEERAVGLMFRQSLPTDTGMLFIYPDDQTSGHWMRNTYIPLDIAYVDARGLVIEVRQGRPLDETPLRPQKPYRFALEMTVGWFESHALGQEIRIVIPKDLPVAK